MPTGRTKKMKKSMMPEEAAAADDYVFAYLPKKKKKSACTQDEAEATADYRSASLPKKRKKKQMKKESVLPEQKATDGGASNSDKKKTTEENKQQEEEKQIEKKIFNDSDDQSPPLYLVVRHAVKRPAYSVYGIKHTIATADNPLPVPCRVKYLDAAHDMSFAAVNSERRSWIVGVGGFAYPHQDRPPHGAPAQTIVFDCKTGLVAKGPRPTASKYEPVLFAVGDRVYALSRMPWRHPDFAPWFEVLDLSDASCVDGQLADCTWCPLPSPPLFPILNMEGTPIDQWPPVVEVESYAVVDHYILVSIVVDPFTEKEAGTVVFDTSTEKWHCVDHKRNLPSIGEAVPYEYGNLFLGRSKDQEDVIAYNSSITKTKKTGRTPKLSIVEVSITVAMTSNDLRVVPGQFFSSLGNGIICEVGWAMFGRPPAVR